MTVTLTRRNGQWALGEAVDDQVRVPKGNGELSGRWVDMPGKALDDAARALRNQNTHSALSVDLRPASEADKAEYKKRFGKAIPPAWTDVHVDFGEGAELIARGKSANGKVQYQYTEAYHAKQDAVKYQRLDDVFAAVPALDKELSNIGDDPARAAARLMYLEGIRVGSTDKQVGKVMAYGATTLRAKHVTLNDDSVDLSFVAKEGIPVEYHITDPELVEFIRTRLASPRDPEEKLFETDSGKTIDLLKQISGLPEMKNHDLRTLLANRIAAAEVRKAMPPKPTTKKEALAIRKRIAEIVAAQLRNKPAQALSSYINPAVFAPLMEVV